MVNHKHIAMVEKVYFTWQKWKRCRTKNLTLEWTSPKIQNSLLIRCNFSYRCNIQQILKFKSRSCWSVCCCCSSTSYISWLFLFHRLKWNILLYSGRTETREWFWSPLQFKAFVWSINVCYDFCACDCGVFVHVPWMFAKLPAAQRLNSLLRV